MFQRFKTLKIILCILGALLIIDLVWGYYQLVRVVPVASINLVIVNDSLSDADAQKLLEKMQYVFKAPVTVTHAKASVESAYDLQRGQYRAEDVLRMEDVFKGQKKDEYMLAFIPGDMYTGHLNFAFAATDKGSERTVFSLSRLIVHETGNAQQDLVLRLYKLMLRRLGQMAGLAGSSCGPMAFSNSMPELDDTPAVYCLDDLHYLIQHGYAK